jgi:hypothetical protein
LRFPGLTIGQGAKTVIDNANAKANYGGILIDKGYKSINFEGKSCSKSQHQFFADIAAVSFYVLTVDVSNFFDSHTPSYHAAPCQFSRPA